VSDPNSPRSAAGLSESAYAAQRAGNTREALAGYSELVARFADDPRPDVRRLVNLSMYNAAAVLATRGEIHEALEKLERLLARAGAGDPESEVIQQQAEELRESLRSSADKVVAVEVVEGREAILESTRLGEVGEFEASIRVSDAVASRFAGADYPALRLVVAEALYNTAIARREQGRPADAVSTLAEVINQFGEDPDPAMRSRCAIVLFNLAIVLGSIGDVERAVAAYRKLRSRYRHSTDLATRRRVARSLLLEAELLDDHADVALDRLDELLATFPLGDHDRTISEVREAAQRQRARSLEQLGRVNEALSTLDELAAQARDDSSVATALIDKAEMLIADGRFDDAEAASVRLLRWFNAHDDHEQRDIVARALDAMTFLLGVRRPLHRELASLDASRLSLKQRLRSLGRSKREYEEDVERQLRVESKRYLEDHRLAARIVMRRRRLGEPLVLYLRGFELEVRRAVGRRRLGRPAMSVSSFRIDSESFDRTLAEVLRAGPPIVGLVNPGDTMSWYRRDFPRLELPHDGWQQTVAELIGLADRVVMYLSAMTPGVAEEVDLLVRLGANARTLVVFADSEGAGGANPLFEDLAEFYGAASPLTEPMHSSDSRFDEFPLVFAEARLDWDAVRSFLTSNTPE
jgi:tetratricopeptide (TPR) repeat protein